MPNKFWVGLDAMLARGDYIWADGRILTSEEVTSLFASGQPDSAGCCEACVVFWPLWDGLNDIKCDKMHYTVCEVVVSN